MGAVSSYVQTAEVLMEVYRQEILQLTARAESAEADRDGWKLLYQDSLDREIKQQARAETAEAEVEHLQVQVDKAWLAYQTAEGVAAARWDEMQKLFALLKEMEAKNTQLREQVALLREALTEALDPNTEWTSLTWARLLAIRDGGAAGTRSMDDHV